MGIQDEETASSWEPKTPAPLGGSSPWSFLISRCAAHPTFFFFIFFFCSRGEKKAGGPSTAQPQQGVSTSRREGPTGYTTLRKGGGGLARGKKGTHSRAPARLCPGSWEHPPREREKGKRKRLASAPRAAPTMSAPSSPSPPAPPPSTRFSRHTATTATSSSASLPAPSPSPPSPSPPPSPSLTLGLGLWLSVTWTSAHSLAYGYHIALLNGVREALVHDVGMGVSSPPPFFFLVLTERRGDGQLAPRLFTAPVTDEATPSPLPLPTFPYLASFASAPPPLLFAPIPSPYPSSSQSHPDSLSLCLPPPAPPCSTLSLSSRLILTGRVWSSSSSPPSCSFCASPSPSCSPSSPLPPPSIPASLPASSSSPPRPRIIMRISVFRRLFFPFSAPLPNPPLFASSPRPVLRLWLHHRRIHARRSRRIVERRKRRPETRRAQDATAGERVCGGRECRDRSGANGDDDEVGRRCAVGGKVSCGDKPGPTYWGRLGLPADTSPGLRPLVPFRLSIRPHFRTCLAFPVPLV